MLYFKIKRIIIFSLIFSYFFFLVYLFLWKEFLTYILMRHTLQSGYPYFYIFKTILIFFPIFCRFKNYRTEDIFRL